MPVSRMSVREARANFSDLLGRVYYGKEAVIVEKNGKPVAVVVSPDEYDRLEDERSRDWEQIRRMGERNADQDPDEVHADVTAEVEAVRQEMYERRRTAKSRR